MRSGCAILRGCHLTDGHPRDAHSRRCHSRESGKPLSRNKCIGSEQHPLARFRALKHSFTLHRPIELGDKSILSIY
jgi:hypothetical protein